MHDRGALSTRYEAVIEDMARRLEAEQSVARLWSGDASLWHPSAETQAGIQRRLGWLRQPDGAALKQSGSALSAPAATPLILVASGPVAAHARLWHAATGWSHNVSLLDTAQRDAVDTLLSAPRPPRVVIAGNELSPELEALVAPLETAGAPLAVLTAPGSEVDAWRAVRGLVSYGALPHDVSERWGLFSAFGWLPPALAGADTVPLLQGGAEMATRCRSTGPRDNPGLWLGAALGAFAQAGRDKLVLLAAPELRPLAEWIALFVGGSLAKHRRGFVPIVEEAAVPPEHYGRDHLFVVLERGENAAPLTRSVEALVSAGYPVLRYRLPDASAMLAHAMCWQVGVALAATAIGINPFDEPDTVALRRALRSALVAPARPVEPGLALPGPATAVAWQRAVARRRTSYAALVPYWNLADEERSALSELRRLLRLRGIPALVVEPLRDPQAATQLLHAGRQDGTIIALTRSGAASADLAALVDARLAIDLGAWRRQRRELLHLDVGATPMVALAAYAEILAAQL